MTNLKLQKPSNKNYSAFYSPVSIRKLFTSKQIKKSETKILLLLWMITSIASITLGGYVAIEQLAGLDISFGPIEFHYTFYPSMIICTVLFFWLGFWWAFIPAYFSSFTVAIVSGVSYEWALLFGFADLIPFAVYALAYRNFSISYNLKNWKSISFFVFIVLIGALTSSTASFLWSYINNLEPDKIFAVWQGWWIGGFLRVIFVATIIIYFFSQKVEKTKRKYFKVLSHKYKTHNTILIFIIICGVVISSFVLMAIVISNLSLLKLAASESVNLDIGQLFEALGPLRITAWVSLIITFFVTVGGIYLSKFWNNYLEEEVKKHAAEISRTNKLLNETESISKVGGWEYDVESEELFWTDEIFNIYALNKKNGNKIDTDESFSFYNEDDRKDITEAFNKAVELGKPFDLTVRATNVKGEKLWIRTIGKPEIKSGSTLRVYGNIINITEQKVNEQKIIKSEGNYRTLFNYVPDGILIADEKSYYLDANESICKMLRYERNEIIGMHAIDIVAPVEVKNIDPALDAIKQDTEYESEWEFIRKDGSKFIAEVKVAKLPDSNLIALIQDLTERKQAEKNLTESNERFKKAFHSNMFAMGISTLDGKFVDANKEFCNLIGYSFDEIVGKTTIDLGLVDESTRTRNLEILQDENMTNTLEMKWRISDGSYRNVLFSVQSIFLGGVPHNLATGMDITERKKTELELLESQRRLNYAQHVAKMGDFIWELDAGEISWSDGMYELVGYEKSDNIDFSKINEKIHHPEDFDEINKWLKESIESGNKILEPMEYRILQKSGEVIYVRTVGEIDYQNNIPKSIFGTVTDITPQKTASRMLIDSEKRYKTLFENQPTIIWVEDFSNVKQRFDELKLNGINDFRKYFDNNKSEIKKFAELVKIVEVNSASLSILECDSKEELIKHLPFYFDSEEAWNVFKDELIDLAEGRTSLENKIPVRTLKGNRKILHFKLIIHPDHHHDLKRVILTFLDITEERNYYHRLNEILNQLNLAITTANVGILVHNLVNDTHEWNEELINIYGLKDIDFNISKVNWINYLHPEDSESINERISKVYEGEAVYDVNFRVVRPNGEIRHIIASASPVKDDKGNIFKTIFINLDVTKIRENELQLDKSEKQIRAMFSSLDKMLEDERKMLARELHDELGQIITSIKMNISLLKNSIISKDYTEDYLETELNEIQENLEISNKTMKHLIQYLRPEYLDNLGLVIAIKHIAEEYTNKYEINVKLLQNIENLKLGPQVENTVFRVVQECMTNIIKHSEAKNVILDMILNEGLLEIAIKDDGIGLNSEDMNKVNSFGIKGMQERLKVIKSNLVIESEPNQGTTVSFSVNI